MKNNRNELFGVHSISLKKNKNQNLEKCPRVLMYAENPRWYSRKSSGFIVTDLGSNLSSTHGSFSLLLGGGEKPTLQVCFMECVKMR